MRWQRADNRKKNPLSGSKNESWVTKSSGALNSDPTEFSDFSARCCRSVLTAGPGMISLYMWTCLSSRPSLSTTKAEGWNFKESPTVRKWPSILSAQGCVSQCLCNDNEPQGLNVHHSVTHIGNYTRRRDLANPVIIKSNIFLNNSVITFFVKVYCINTIVQL